ncbi:MAG: hypothetical protein ACLPWF_20360 [Bryobacteraceae bacterium]
MPTTVSGGAAHGVAALSLTERQAAHNVLAKLKQTGSGLGSHFGGALESATVSGAAALTLRPSTLLSARGSDTFMGGVRHAPATHGVSLGTDTVVSGSTARFGVHPSSHTVAARGAQHFTLNTDTINVAGVTAAHIQAGHPHDNTRAHTVTLADKTTIKIEGLSAHDISKLHH